MNDERLLPPEITAGFDRDGEGFGLVIRPQEMDTLVRAGLVAPVGEGRFRLNVDSPSSQGQAPLVTAGLEGNGAGIRLSGNDEGLRRLEAMLGNLRYSQENNGQGLITRAMEVGGPQGFVRATAAGDYRRADAGLNMQPQSQTGWGARVAAGVDNQGARNVNLQLQKRFW